MKRVLDTQAALERLEGDLQLLRELAEIFRENATQLLTQIRDACARQDVPALLLAAHSLKGSAANLSAEAVCHVAEQLEQLTFGRDLRGCSPLVASLEAEMQRLERALTQFL